MFRKITALILAAAMLLSMTGCVSVKQDAYDAGPGSAENKENEAVPENGADTEKQEDADAADAGVQKLAAAVYPEAVRKVSSEDYIRSNGSYDDDGYSRDQEAWTEVWREQQTLADGLQDLIKPFCRTASAFLQDNGGENRVCSPLNLYIALTMLAEAAEGETRAEILEILGADSMEKARDLAVRLWRSNYVDNGELLTDLASSLWLRNGLEVNEDTLKQIADSYYADVFSGDPEDPAYNQALQDWLNEKTGGLLREAVQGVQMDPEMLLSLASTIYFRGKWQYPFDPAKNRTMTFHGTDGDTEAEFMYKMTDDQYRFYDHFGAVGLQMSGNDTMWLILPDEGYTPEEIAASQDFIDCLTAAYDEDHMKYTLIEMSVPKFDVSSDQDLCDALKALGMQQAFDLEKADFSGLITEETPMYLSQVKHAARCVIDEEGCTATAFTLEMLCGSAMPDGTVEFTLDRPFLFAITSYTGAILFTGIVNQMN